MKSAENATLLKEADDAVRQLLGTLHRRIQPQFGILRRFVG
jgi:hypothetical protein